MPKLPDVQKTAERLVRMVTDPTDPLWTGSVEAARRALTEAWMLGYSAERLDGPASGAPDAMDEAHESTGSPILAFVQKLAAGSCEWGCMWEPSEQLCVNCEARRLSDIIWDERQMAEGVRQEQAWVEQARKPKA